jgi:hypothetical protein
MDSTNRQLADKGQHLAEAARQARAEMAQPAAGGFGGDRVAQETTGGLPGWQGKGGWVKLLITSDTHVQGTRKTLHS